MKLQTLATLTLMLIGIPQILAGCLPNNDCVKKRDTIIQLNETIIPSEIEEGLGRTWRIRPSLEPFNAILAFKNFSSLVTSVLVLSYTTGEEGKSIQYFYGNLTDFEVVFEDVIDVIVYVPITEENNANFVLNYYTGCDFLSSASDQINAMPSKTSREKDEMKCWFVQPSDVEDRKRIYFSVKDVALNEGQELSIWDIHTMAVIMEAEDGDAYQLVAAETQGHQTVIIDLICTNPRCSTKLNSFAISYYAMTKEDVACIEMQTLCDSKENLTMDCNITCPAFDNMITMEYGSQITGSFLKKESLPEDEEEDEDEETRPAKRRRKCPFPKPLCRCRRTFEKEAFCDPEIKCFELAQCTFACIFHKLTTCIKITILNSLKLL